MAVTSGHTTVGTSATIIDGVSTNPSRLHIHNADNSDDLFLGNSSVTTSTGLQLTKLDSIELTLNAGESLYAVSGIGSHAVSWLRQTQD
jgi:hypothetical protein